MGRQFRPHWDRWRPGGRGERTRGSPVALRHRLSAAMLWAAYTRVIAASSGRARADGHTSP